MTTLKLIPSPFTPRTLRGEPAERTPLTSADLPGSATLRWRVHPVFGPTASAAWNSGASGAGADGGACSDHERPRLDPAPRARRLGGRDGRTLHPDGHPLVRWLQI